MTSKNERIATKIVDDHIAWHRTGRPRPIGGFPADYFADWLEENIRNALLKRWQDGFFFGIIFSSAIWFLFI